MKLTLIENLQMKIWSLCWKVVWSVLTENGQAARQVRKYKNPVVDQTPKSHCPHKLGYAADKNKWCGPAQLASQKLAEWL